MLIQARLKDKYNKTTFIFTRADKAQGDMLKASARAAEGVNVIEALNNLNRQFPQLITTYGGHAKAAGLLLRPSRLSAFTQAIEKIIATQLINSTVDNSIYTDGELLPYELNVANAEFLRVLEPWGSHLPEPLFENTFYIEQIREVGKNHAQLLLIESQSGQAFKGIAFNQYAYYDSLVKKRCRIAYRLDINEWRGQRTLSLVISHIETI